MFSDSKSESSSSSIDKWKSSLLSLSMVISSWFSKSFLSLLFRTFDVSWSILIGLFKLLFPWLLVLFRWFSLSEFIAWSSVSKWLFSKGYIHVRSTWMTEAIDRVRDSLSFWPCCHSPMLLENGAVSSPFGLPNHHLHLLQECIVFSLTSLSFWPCYYSTIATIVV